MRAFTVCCAELSINGADGAHRNGENGSCFGRLRRLNEKEVCHDRYNSGLARDACPVIRDANAVAKNAAQLM